MEQWRMRDELIGDDIYLRERFSDQGRKYNKKIII